MYKQHTQYKEKQTNEATTFFIYALMLYHQTLSTFCFIPLHFPSKNKNDKEKIISQLFFVYFRAVMERFPRTNLWECCVE